MGVGDERPPVGCMGRDRARRGSSRLEDEGNASPWALPRRPQPLSFGIPLLRQLLVLSDRMRRVVALDNLETCLTKVDDIDLDDDDDDCLLLADLERPRCRHRRGEQGLSSSRVHFFLSISFVWHWRHAAMTNWLTSCLSLFERWSGTTMMERGKVGLTL